MFTNYDGEVEGDGVSSPIAFEPKRLESLGIEELLPTFFDAHALREVPYKVYREHRGDDRWYYRPDTDRHYVSTTTAIKSTRPTPIGIQNWQKTHGHASDDMRDERAAYGTFLHIQFARLLIEKRYNLNELPALVSDAARGVGLDPNLVPWVEDAQRDLLAMEAFRRAHDVRPLAIELVLTSETMGVGGAVDLICAMRWGTGSKNCEILKRDGDGIEGIAILDFKSGRKGFYEEHELQLGIYKPMTEENFPDIKVDACFNWRPSDWRTEPGWHLTNQTDKPSWRQIPWLLGQYFSTNPSGPSPRLRVQGEITPDKPLSECYSFEDLRSRFQEVAL